MHLCLPPSPIDHLCLRSISRMCPIDQNLPMNPWVPPVHQTPIPTPTHHSLLPMAAVAAPLVAAHRLRLLPHLQVAVAVGRAGAPTVMQLLLPEEVVVAGANRPPAARAQAGAQSHRPRLPLQNHPSSTAAALPAPVVGMTAHPRALLLVPKNFPLDRVIGPAPTAAK